MNPGYKATHTGGIFAEKPKSSLLFVTDGMWQPGKQPELASEKETRCQFSTGFVIKKT